MMDAVADAVVQEIRDELRTMRGLSAGMDQPTQRLEALSSRLDEMREGVGRVEAALLDLAEQQRLTARWLGTWSGQQRQLEEKVRRLEDRVGAIEARLPDRSG